MSTRGLYGFRYKSVDKGTYNHADSYPRGLGKNILEFCSRNTIEDMAKLYNKIVVVKEESEPTKEQIEECISSGYLDRYVGNGSEKAGTVY